MFYFNVVGGITTICCLHTISSSSLTSAILVIVFAMNGHLELAINISVVLQTQLPWFSLLFAFYAFEVENLQRAEGVP